MAAPALEAQSASMRRCGRSLLLSVSLTAERGELLALCGSEGSGTGTLLHLLSGHLVADSGRVLVDGRERLARHRLTGPDPRRLAHGPDEASAMLADPGGASVLLCEQPTLGLAEPDAHTLLATARRAADDGAAVVLTADVPDLVARHASTLALFVAGRLLSWAAPPVALAPALHILGPGDLAPSGARTRSILTSSS